MTPHAPDHLLVAFVVFAVPWLAVVEYRRLLQALRAGAPGARSRSYRRTILHEWAFGGLVAALWAWSGRPLSSLGLSLDLDTGRGAWVGYGLTLAGCALLVAQTVAVWRGADARAAIREQVQPFEPLLPHTATESRWFVVVSITAGVCEEVVYRGFFMAYLAPLGTLSSVALSSLAFGVGHLYLGRTGAIRAGLLGLVTAVLYALTGSLWAPMLLHAAMDVTSGLMSRRALADPGGTSGPDLTPATT